MKKNGMKTVMKIAILLLCLLALVSCKTKEKVTDSVKETVQTSTSSSAITTAQAECSNAGSSSDEAFRTQWSDSIVEKYHERIVTDSSGRVLWHETEHSKDRYTGRSEGKTGQTSSHTETTAGKSTATARENNDSVYNGGVLKEVTITETRSWSWLWQVGLLVLPLIIVAIIYKVRK